MATLALKKSRSFPILLGIGAFVAAIALVELLIRVGVINRFIVPLPSEIFFRVMAKILAVRCGPFVRGSIRTPASRSIGRASSAIVGLARR